MTLGMTFCTALCMTLCTAFCKTFCTALCTASFLFVLEHIEGVAILTNGSIILHTLLTRQLG